MARRPDEGNTPVRPKIAMTKMLTNFEEAVEEAKENTDEEITWWKPKERKEDEDDEEEVIEQHPSKWWYEEDKGLGRYGLRVDPLDEPEEA